MEQLRNRPGFRPVDRRDFLEGRPPFSRNSTEFDREFGLDHGRHYEAMRMLRSMLSKLEPSIPESDVDTDNYVSPSTWLELVQYALMAMPNALIMEFLWPNQLWIKVVSYLCLSPMSLIHILVGANVAYTDRRDIAKKNAGDSVTTLAAYIVTSLALPSVSAFWNLAKVLVRFIWSNLALAAVTCWLLFYVRKHYEVPAFWALVVSKSSEWQGRVITELTNVLYIIYWTAITLVGKMASATGILINTIWRTRIFMLETFGIQPRRDFSYSALPRLDSIRDLDGKTSQEQEDEQTPKIRLLQLPRRSLWPFQTLRANLEAYNLENAPPYHAISYVWSHGSQDLRSIVLNDMEYRVCGNVHDILTRCSSYFGPRLIWIDTICINQEDKDEKTLQVRRMQDIYKCAGQVLVCLGEDPGIGTAMQLVWELNFIMNTYGKIYLGQHVATFNRRRQYDKYLCARIEALLDLLSHPWFERIWVIQEVVVAQRVNIFYGNHSMPWSAFHKSIAAITTAFVNGVWTAYNLARPASTLPSPFRNLGKIAFLAGYRLEYQLTGARSITYVLRMFLKWRATEGIDKIFGIIGLSASSGESEFLTQLVDYNRPPEETLLLFSNHLLDAGEALKVLDIAGIGWDQSNLALPSWIVDWRRPDFQIPMSREFVPKLEYNAAGTQPSVITRGKNEREIVVRGQFIDRIALLASKSVTYSENTQPPISAFPDITDYIEEIKKLAQDSVPDPYPHIVSQPLREALWRTMIGDRTHFERPAPRKYEDILRTMLDLARSMNRHIRAQGMDLFSTYPSDELQREFHMHDPDFWAGAQAMDNDFQDIDFLFDNPGGQRRFAVTERKYMGIVPNGSKAGDIVCVLFGTKVPFILRACTAPGQQYKYQLVGEAYIHGMMDGQALDLIYSAVDFTII